MCVCVFVFVCSCVFLRASVFAFLSIAASFILACKDEIFILVSVHLFRTKKMR